MSNYIHRVGRFINVAAVVLALVAILGITVLGSRALAGVPIAPTTTTLDACGYFTGIQTATNSRSGTNPDGTAYSSDEGTWIGVWNNGGPLVASLGGQVNGQYRESSTGSYDAQTLSGTEKFESKWGTITQVYSYTGTWTVSVVATGDLSFLTSDTNGNCYSGPYPRP